MRSQHSAQLLKLLQHGVTPTEASRAMGITPSAVTQLMQTEEIAPQVEEIRKKQIERSSALDAKYDHLEEVLVARLEQTVPLLMKPREIMDVLQKVNGAKRRGVVASTPTAAPTVVHLHLPTQIKNKFIVNSNNQVVAVGEQQLITMQSSNIAKLAEAKNALPAPTAETDEFGFPVKR